jgi:hypothetical protein
MGTLCRGKDCKAKRKRYSREFQGMAVERMRSWDNIGDLAKELGVGRRCRNKWQAKLDHLEPGVEAPRTSSHESSYRQQVHRLKRLLAEKTLEVDFSRVPCKKSRLDARRAAKLARRHLLADPRSDVVASPPEYRAYVRIGTSQPGQFLPIFSRTAARRGRDGDTVCNSTNRHRAPSTLRLPPYFSELRRRGMQINHKRVMRIMAEDNLLAVQGKSLVVTTNSHHEFEVYLNLAGRMKSTRNNQLWVADITYIRLQRELSIWPWFSMLFHGKWWAGNWSARWRSGCHSRHSSRRSRNENQGLV